MKGLLALLLVLVAGQVGAGNLGVYTCPSADPDVTHFAVYADGGLVLSKPIGELEPLLEAADCNLDGTASTDPSDQMRGMVVPAPDGCQTRTYHATFSVGALESNPSPTIASQARPTVPDALVNDDTGIDKLLGHNLAGATVEVFLLDGTPIPVLSATCTVIDIQDTITRTVVVKVTPAGHEGPLKPYIFTYEVEAPTGLVVR